MLALNIVGADDSVRPHNAMVIVRADRVVGPYICIRSKGKNHHLAE